MQVASNILTTMKGVFVLEKLAGKTIPFHGALHTPPSSENLLFFPQQGGDHFPFVSEVGLISLNCLEIPRNSTAFVTCIHHPTRHLIIYFLSAG